MNLRTNKFRLPHNLYSGTKPIPLFSKRPFHFYCSTGALFWIGGSKSYSAHKIFTLGPNVSHKGFFTFIVLLVPFSLWPDKPNAVTRVTTMENVGWPLTFHFRKLPKLSLVQTYGLHHLRNLVKFFVQVNKLGSGTYVFSYKSFALTWMVILMELSIGF